MYEIKETYSQQRHKRYRKLLYWKIVFLAFAGLLMAAGITDVFGLRNCEKILKKIKNYNLFNFSKIGTEEQGRFFNQLVGWFSWKSERRCIVAIHF